MPEQPTPILDTDIYRTWGRNKTRIDFPAYGPEYAEWKRTIPLDVQKTLLDLATARRINSENIGLHTREEFLSSQLPPERYEEVRTRNLAIALETADSFRSFLEEKYSGLLSRLYAVGMDGSGLYRPREKGDVDVFVLFDTVDVEVRKAIRDFKDMRRASDNGKEDIRTDIALYPFKNDEGIVHAGKEWWFPWAALPHKIVRNYNLSDGAYEQAREEAIIIVRKNKKKYYDKSRWYIKKKGYTWDELTEMVKRDRVED